MRLLVASARKPASDMRVRAGICKKRIANPAQMQAGSIGKFLIDADPFDSCMHHINSFPSSTKASPP
jgi:hypothetical protein